MVEGSASPAEEAAVEERTRRFLLAVVDSESEVEE